MPKYDRVLTVRIDRELQRMIEECWKAMPQYPDKSELVRDLLRIAYAVVKGTKVELSDGRTIVVNSPTVILKLHPKRMRRDIGFEIRHVSRARYLLRNAFRRLSSLGKLVALERNEAVFVKDEERIVLSKHALDEILQKTYKDIAEAIAMLDMALERTETEEQPEHATNEGGQR